MSQNKTHSSYANKGDLTQGSIVQHLVRLSIPMVWGIFVIVSFQLVDTFYISMLGTEPLAAISFTFPVTFILFSLTMGMSIATSSVLSRQIGEGNDDRVKRIASHGLIFALLVGIVLAVIGIAVMDPVFKAMGATDDMLPIIRDYMLIWFGGSYFLSVPMVGNAAMRAAGDSRIPAVIMTVVALTNVILDPLLIFGLLGFPALGVKGAALATVIANIAGMCASVYVLYARKKMIFQDGICFRHFGDSVKRLAFIALPVGITGMIQPVANAFIISLLAVYGAETVAAYGVATRLEAFAFVILMALATGMAPIVGQNWGAKKFDRVHETLNKVFAFAGSWSLFIAIIFMLGAQFIAGLFSDNPEFIDTARMYFWIVALTYVPGNLIAGWGSAFNAMGMPQRSFIMSALRLLVLQVPLAYIGSYYWGLSGVFCAIATTNLVTGVGFHLWNSHTCQRKEQEVGS